MDIEYFYKIYPNAIEVYEVTYETNEFKRKDISEWKLIRTIEL